MNESNEDYLDCDNSLIECINCDEEYLVPEMTFKGYCPVCGSSHTREI